MNTTPTGAAILRDPTDAIIDAILRREGWPRYTEEPGFAGITDGALPALVIASGINHGPARAGTWLQDAVNDIAGRPILKVDGAVGSKTLAAVNSADAAGLWRAIFVARMCFYGDLISGDAPEARSHLRSGAQRRRVVQPAGRIHEVPTLILWTITPRRIPVPASVLRDRSASRSRSAFRCSQPMASPASAC